MCVLHFEADFSKVIIAISDADTAHAAINQKKEEDMIGKGFI